MLYDLDTNCYKYSYDPIAIALLLHSHNIDPHRVIYDTERANVLAEQNHKSMFHYCELATEIREFYKGKMMMYSLKGVLNTHFRRDLLELLQHEDRREYASTELRQLASLPSMYNEDKTLLEISTQCNTDPFTVVKVPRPTDTIAQLEFLGSHMKRSRRISMGKNQREYLCYWFIDEYSRANLIEMDLDNPFSEIWVDLIQNTLTIQGTRTEHSRDQINFHSWPTFRIMHK